MLYIISWMQICTIHSIGHLIFICTLWDKSNGQKLQRTRMSTETGIRFLNLDSTTGRKYTWKKLYNGSDKKYLLQKNCFMYDIYVFKITLSVVLAGEWFCLCLMCIVHCTPGRSVVPEWSLVCGFVFWHLCTDWSQMLKSCLEYIDRDFCVIRGTCVEGAQCTTVVIWMQSYRPEEMCHPHYAKILGDVLTILGLETSIWLIHWIFLLVQERMLKVQHTMR